MTSHHPLTDRLLESYRGGQKLAGADTLPADLAETYRIQTELALALGEIGAWKLAPVPAEDAPSCSPLPASVIAQNGARIAADGTRAEVEIAVTLAADLDEDRPYTPEDLRAAIAGVHLALEFIGSRYADPAQMPALATSADLQNNVAIVLGPLVSFDELPEFAQQDIALFDNGNEIARTEGNSSTAATLSALAWLARHARSRGLPLRAGTVVITGARIGPIEVDGPALEARASGLGTVTTSIG